VVYSSEGVEEIQVLDQICEGSRLFVVSGMRALAEVKGPYICLPRFTVDP
jgi:hypothetical protein